MRKLLTWLLVLLLPLACLAEAPLFTEGAPHASHLDYRQYFETMSAEVGVCTLAIAKDAYDADVARQLHAQVAADEAALAELGVMRPHTVYVVKKPMAGMQRIGSAIYCTAAQMMDGSYRPWLTEAALGVETWRAVGLAGHVFGDSVDEAALSAWYADAVNDDMLSLFQAYFVEEFASAEERAMTAQTAAALVGWIIEQDGLNAAFTAEPSAYVQGWLASLGIERTYKDEYTGLLDGYTWTHNQFYPLIATSPKGDVFKLKPLFDMDSPELVRMALCDLELAVDAILEGVGRDAPDWYPVLAKNVEGPITYEFGESDGYSITYFANRRVTVGGAQSLIHETTHMMTPCKIERISRYMDQWKVEGIAEFLTHAYYYGRPEQAAVWPLLQVDFSSTLDGPKAQKFYEHMRDVYLCRAPMPETPGDMDLTLFWRAAVVAKSEMGMQLNSVSGVYAGAGSASLDAVNGNELSYTEAEWLASYLINRHGLSTFLHYCMDEGVSFEEAFGMSYEDAKADWLANRTLLD